MKLKYLFFCLILIGFMGCESESSSGGGEGSETGNATSEQPAEPTYNLKWTVPNDYSFVQKGKQATKITTNPGTEGEEISKLSVTTNRKFNIGKVDKEGAFGVTCTFMAVMGEQKGPNSKWIYDSNADKGNASAGGLEKLSGTTVQFRIDPNSGQIFEVFDSEELNNVVASGPKLERPDKAVQELWQPEWYVFPDGPVKLNQEWTREFKMRHNTQSLFTTNFQIASRENGQAKITYTGTVSPLAQADMIMEKAPNGESNYMELNGTTSGEIVVDEASGAFISQTAAITMEGHAVKLDKNGLEKNRVPLKIEIENFSEYQQN